MIQTDYAPTCSIAGSSASISAPLIFSAHFNCLVRDRHIVHARTKTPRAEARSNGRGCGRCGRRALRVQIGAATRNSALQFSRRARACFLSTYQVRCSSLSSADYRGTHRFTRCPPSPSARLIAYYLKLSVCGLRVSQFILPPKCSLRRREMLSVCQLLHARLCAIQRAAGGMDRRAHKRRSWRRSAYNWQRMGCGDAAHGGRWARPRQAGVYGSVAIMIMGCAERAAVACQIDAGQRDARENCRRIVR